MLEIGEITIIDYMIDYTDIVTIDHESITFGCMTFWAEIPYFREFGDL